MLNSLNIIYISIKYGSLGNGKIILDDKMNKNRTYFYRPNHDQTDENAWLSEMFKDVNE